MSPTFLTIYVLMWPVLVAGVLIVLVRAFRREWRHAKQEGRPLI